MYRLGLELTLKGGREALARLLLTISAVAVGVVILLAVFAGYHALQQTSNRPSWESTSGSPITAPPRASSNVLLWNYSESIYQGQSIEHLQLAAAGPNAPVVPGVAELPEPGEFYASPALASLLQTVPRDQLGDRFPGRQIGTIEPVGLSSPNQLAIIVGSTPQQLLQQHGTVAVSRISSAAHASSGSREVLLLAALAVLFPLLILINTATRLSAARREERYAAMRLIGATPRQINALASVDAVVGALLGSLVFVAYDRLSPAHRSPGRSSSRATSRRPCGATSARSSPFLVSPWLVRCSRCVGCRSRRSVSLANRLLRNDHEHGDSYPFSWAYCSSPARRHR
jgi:hypothetical protein